MSKEVLKTASVVVPSDHAFQGGVTFTEIEEGCEGRQGESGLLSRHCQIGVTQVEHDLMVERKTYFLGLQLHAFDEGYCLADGRQNSTLFTHHPVNNITYQTSHLIPDYGSTQ